MQNNLASCVELGDYLQSQLIFFFGGGGLILFFHPDIYINR